MKEPRKKTAVDEAIERAIKIGKRARETPQGSMETIRALDAEREAKKILEDPDFEKQALMEEMMRQRMTELPPEAVMLGEVFDVNELFPTPTKMTDYVFERTGGKTVVDGFIPEDQLKSYELEAKRPKPMWKFGELESIHALEQYIAATYEQHYASQEDGIQAYDAILAAGHGVGFCVGDIIKYAMRLGKKDGWNRKDVMKILHYGILLLHAMDKEKK